MPVFTTTRKIDTSTPPQLMDAKGRPTLEAQVISGFLSDCDWTPLFEHPVLKPYITKTRIVVKEDAGRLVPCVANSTGAMPIEVFTIPGKIAAEAVDQQDLMGLFKHYLNREYPRESLAHKLALDPFADLLESRPFQRDVQPKNHAATVMEMLGQSMMVKPTAPKPLKAKMPAMMNKVGSTLQAPPPAPKMASPTESIKQVRCAESLNTDRLDAARKASPVQESTAPTHSGPLRAAGAIRHINENRAHIGGAKNTTSKSEAITEGLRNGTFDLVVKGANRHRVA